MKTSIQVFLLEILCFASHGTVSRAQSTHFLRIKNGDTNGLANANRGEVSPVFCGGLTRSIELCGISRRPSCFSLAAIWLGWRLTRPPQVPLGDTSCSPPPAFIWWGATWSPRLPLGDMLLTGMQCDSRFGAWLACRCKTFGALTWLLHSGGGGGSPAPVSNT